MIILIHCLPVQNARSVNLKKVKKIKFIIALLGYYFKVLLLNLTLLLIGFRT